MKKHVMNPCSSKVVVPALLLAVLLLVGWSALAAEPVGYVNETYGYTLELEADIYDQLIFVETDNAVDIYYKDLYPEMGKLVTLTAYSPKSDWLTQGQPQVVPHTIVAETETAFIAARRPSDVQWDVRDEAATAAYNALSEALSPAELQTRITADKPPGGDTFTFTSAAYGFTLELPSALANALYVDGEDGYLRFHHVASDMGTPDGTLFTIRIYQPRSAWITEQGTFHPSYELLAAGEDAVYAVWYPTDIRYPEDQADAYMGLWDIFCMTGYFQENLTVHSPAAIPVLTEEPGRTYVSGDTAGRLNPDAGITRAEAATMVHRLIDADNKVLDQGVTFTDVQPGAWYYQAVSYLASYGWLQGDDDGAFRPGDVMTRTEFATLLFRAAGLDNTLYGESVTFPDVPTDHWSALPIRAVSERGWVTGYPDGTFRPDQPVTRAEAVTMLNRALGRTTANSDADPDLNPYPDLQADHWAFGDLLNASGL